MTVWFKQGVIGDLNNPTQKCFGRIARLYEKEGYDFYVTALRDGNHMAGSFHYIGGAFDFKIAPKITLAKLKIVAGKDFDIVIHSAHIHIEYDPK